MKRYTAIIIIEVLVVVIALGMVIKTAVTPKNGESAKSDANAPPVLSGAEDILDDGTASSGKQDSGGKIPSGNGGSVNDENEEDNGDTEGSGDSNGLIGYLEGLPGESNGQNWSQVSGHTITAEIPTISFPYEISNTDIVIKQVSSYSGYFIEDGSDREVNGVTAIVLENNGGDLDFVGIGIAQGVRNLAFSGSQIPAGATVIIQEQSGAAFTNDPFYSATANITPGEFEKNDDLITVKDNKNGTFSVINTSEEMLPVVKVFFKNYLPEEDVYVGGITYSVTLEDVEPDMEVEVTATHYDPAYTVFIDVRLGE